MAKLVNLDKASDHDLLLFVAVTVQQHDEIIHQIAENLNLKVDADDCEKKHLSVAGKMEKIQNNQTNMQISNARTSGERKGLFYFITFIIAAATAVVTAFIQSVIRGEK